MALRLGALNCGTGPGEPRWTLESCGLGPKSIQCIRTGFSLGCEPEEIQTDFALVSTRAEDVELAALRNSLGWLCHAGMVDRMVVDVVGPLVLLL